MTNDAQIRPIISFTTTTASNQQHSIQRFYSLFHTNSQRKAFMKSFIQIFCVLWKVKFLGFCSWNRYLFALSLSTCRPPYLHYSTFLSFFQWHAVLMGLCIGREREVPGEGEEEEEDLKAPVPHGNSSPSLASQKLTHSRPSMTGPTGGSRASTPSASAVTTKLMSNGSSRTASPMHHGSLVSPATYGSQVGVLRLWPLEALGWSFIHSTLKLDVILCATWHWGALHFHVNLISVHKICRWLKSTV